MRVVATAGHVDHGKSTLVEALTGTDPDRWAEEKARGLTIDLGFAATTLPSGQEIAFVDVPGHRRFIANMLAGVGTVDSCLFVVSALEGWKPQSEEHLRILDLLGVRHGVVAMSFAGQLADAAARRSAAADLAPRFAGTFLAAAPIVAVDAPAGLGLDELRDALDAMPPPPVAGGGRGRPRLWVDRSFSLPGAGTVVTGTLTGGELRIGDDLVAVPWRRAGSPQPAGDQRDPRRRFEREHWHLPPLRGRPVTVRGLQTFHRDRASASPGSRVAVRLGGAAHTDVARGDALVRASQWHASATLDATLRVLASAPVAVAGRGAYSVHVGSGEHAARVRVLGAGAIEPGAQGPVRLHLRAALPLLPGDRYVLRDAGRGTTVGGGEILDVDPILPAGSARPDRRVARVIAERGWIAVDDLERLTGERLRPHVGRWATTSAERQRVEQHLLARVEAAAPTGIPLAELDERERALAADLPALRVDGPLLRAATERTDPLAAHPYLAALAAAPFQPPRPDGIAPAELRHLATRGLALEREGVWFSPVAVDEAGRRVRELLATHPDGVTVGQVRDLLGTTRRWVVPLLGLLDEAGYTRRAAGRRVAGRRE